MFCFTFGVFDADKRVILINESNTSSEINAMYMSPAPIEDIRFNKEFREKISNTKSRVEIKGN